MSSWTLVWTLEMKGYLFFWATYLLQLFECSMFCWKILLVLYIDEKCTLKGMACIPIIIFCQIPAPPAKKKEVRDMRKLVFSFTSGSMLYCVTQIACSGHMKLLLIRSKMSSDPKRNLPAATDWGLSTEFHFHLIPLDYFSREKKTGSRRKNEKKNH